MSTDTATQTATAAGETVETRGGDPARGALIADRYRLERQLGRGAFAVTWQATDTRTGSSVAVKILSLRTVDHWKAVELFEREARVLRNLDHPQIPSYLDFIAPSEGDDRFVLVQALAPGQSLAQLVKAGWRPSEAEARALADQILSILEYLHSRSGPVIHRDIKPANVLRGDDGRVALIDFGSVRDGLASASEYASTAGTFGYMAPEQLTGRATPASDLYGLGATLVNVLSQRAPDQLPQRNLRIDFRGAISVSQGFERWLNRMLAPAPEQRFASAEKARAALREATASAHGERLGGRDKAAASTAASFAHERVSGTVDPDGLTVDIQGDPSWSQLLATVALFFATLTIMGNAFRGKLSLGVLFGAIVVGLIAWSVGKRAARTAMDTRVRINSDGTTIERRLGKWIVHKRHLEPGAPTRFVTRGLLRKDLLLHTRGGTERLGHRLHREAAKQITARIDQALSDQARASTR